MWCPFLTGYEKKLTAARTQVVLGVAVGAIDVVGACKMMDGGLQGVCTSHVDYTSSRCGTTPARVALLKRSLVGEGDVNVNAA